MPTSITSTWLALGTLPVMDTDDSNYVAENAADLVGQSFDTSNGLALTTVTATDANDDGSVSSDDNFATGESVTADGVTSTLDAMITYNVTFTLGDGSSFTDLIGLVQLDDGRAFIVPGSETQLDGLFIETITFDSVVVDNYSGINNTAADWSIDGAKVVCFAAGTRIDTAEGPRLVEYLRPGDMVHTLDHGLQPLRWVYAQRLRARGADAPVRFHKGAWGVRRALKVSGQHRMLIRGGLVEVHFGHPEVLVPAAALVDGQWVTRQSGGWVRYFHLMFDAHEIIFANGVPAESFHPGPQAMAALPGFARRDLLLRFRQAREGGGPLARPALSYAEARILRGARGCLPLSALHSDPCLVTGDKGHGHRREIRHSGGTRCRVDLGPDKEIGGHPHGQPAGAGSGLRRVYP